MIDPIDADRRNWDERAAIHARDATGAKMLDRFRAGEDTLHAIESARFSAKSGNMRHWLAIDDRSRCAASLLCDDSVGTQFARSICW